MEGLGGELEAGEGGVGGDRDLEHRDLESSQDDDLRSEAAMLRVLIRRVFDLSAGIEDLDQAANLLRILALAVGRLSGILRVQALYGLSTLDEERRSLTQALTEVMEELDLHV